MVFNRFKFINLGVEEIKDNFKWHVLATGGRMIVLNKTKRFICKAILAIVKLL